MPAAQNTVVIVAGASGSGKTTLAHYLVNDIFSGNAVLVSVDNYYKPASAFPPGPRNFDTPEALDLERLAVDIECLKAGRAIDMPLYDFEQHDRQAECRRMEPAPVIVVDGIFSLAAPSVRASSDLSIFVEADESRCLARRLQRNETRRARSFQDDIAYYWACVQPALRAIIEPTKRHADVLIQNNCDAPDEMFRCLRRIVAALRPAYG